MTKTQLERNIEADLKEQEATDEIERKHNEWTLEQAKALASGLSASTEPISESNPASKDAFDYVYRAPITESVLNQISTEAKQINIELGENYKERKTINDKIKELETKQEQILSDIRTMTHGITVQAHWEYDFDNEVKRLVTTLHDERIVMETTDMTSIDKQLRLGDDRLPQQSAEGELQPTREEGPDTIAYKAESIQEQVAE